ncbi:N-acetylmuramic acid 6-phosphate etherase [Companilactobacillus sp. DQM5]|uniref:N-acetylmuramic acid 6-phosphate etherase n=1 Tax=Companilactobacillus sp. DQM5 TaxID=3463359 RepID=UPI00405941C6
MNLGKLTTENRNSETTNLDLMNEKEIVTVMNKEDKKVAIAIENELYDIARAVKVAKESLQNGGRLIYMGAGTSGRLGVLDAAECVPTFGTSPDLVLGLIAGGAKAMTVAVEGAEDSKELGANDLKKINLNGKDTVVGIAASGRTPYVIGGLEYASLVKAKTLSISCNKNSEISKLAQVAIEVDVGPEVLTGSTRLKAGTAQKMVLNMISTGSMVMNGKAYENLMVDVLTTNEKLEERAIRMIMTATDTDQKNATKKFKEADKNVKVAILMILTNKTKNEAISSLKKSNGRIRESL